MQAKMSSDIDIAKATIATIDTIETPKDFFDKLGLKTEAARIYVVYALANARLMDRKQLDYGPKNISAFGSFGVIVKMTDKFERLKHIFKSGKRRKAVNESIMDSFRDISNYGVIAAIVERGEWPNE